MEMNTRLQVEHPVTEEITGQDLVEWQLRVASGEKLPLKQSELKINGHAIEARLYAENPEAGFLPSIGKLQTLRFPDMPEDSARVDSAVEQRDEITPYYDPMIAKIIMHGNSRSDAIAKLSKEWNDVCVWPVKTNAGFIGRCLAATDFLAGNIDTSFIAAHEEALTKPPPPSAAAMAQAAQQFHMRFAGTSPVAIRPPHVWASPWSQSQGFRLNAAPHRRVGLLFHGKHMEADLWHAKPRSWTRDGHTIVVFEHGEAYPFELDTGERAEGEVAIGDGAITSPMPGKIVSIAAKQGANVKKGDALLVLEAMKMEHTLTAPFDGKVVELKARAGEQVGEGAVLARIEAV